jgi:WD40 repeat protein
LVTSVKAQSATVNAVRFSPDGRYLVTAGQEGVANVWTVPGGDRVTTLRPGIARLEAAAFTPDGREVAVAGSGGSVEIFECAECRELHGLVCLAGRRVTDQVRAKEEAFRDCD